jgi:hypothetical protein
VKVFVGSIIHDCSRLPIGVVLTAQDRANIAAMSPEATVYCEFVLPAEAAPGTRTYTPASVGELLDLIKARAAGPRLARGVEQVEWVDVGREAIRDSQGA